MIPMAEKDCIDNLERLNFAQDPVPRRELRSDYLAVRNLTSGIYLPEIYVSKNQNLPFSFTIYFVFIPSLLAAERRDELVSPDSEKFDAIIDVVDKLHEQGIPINIIEKLYMF